MKNTPTTTIILSILSVSFGLFQLLLVPTVVHAFTISKPANYLVLNTGLVGYWTFDGPDMTNGVARDRSISGNNGTLLGIASSTFYTLGKIGQALNFDGVNDRIDTHADSIGTGTVTVCAWIKPTLFNDFHAVMGNGKFKILLSQPSNAFVVSSDAGGTLALSAVAPVVGVWQHFCGVRKSGGLGTVYVNGAQSGAADQNTGTPATLDTVVIGNNGGGTEPYTGLIDDVRIYNRVLSAQEIRGLYNMGAAGKIDVSPGQGGALSNGLVGYWTFDGKNMTQNATDSSGQGNTGYLANFTSTTTALGKIGQGLQFDGTDDFVKVLDVPAIRSSSVRTVSFWVMAPLPADAVSHRIIYDDDGTANNVYQILLNGSALSVDIANIEVSVTIGGVTSNLGTENFTFRPNEWLHIVVVWNSTPVIQAIYFNGVSMTLDSGGAPSDVLTAGLSIGARTDASRPFEGKIDDVRIYNRVLSATEIKALYNMGR